MKLALAVLMMSFSLSSFAFSAKMPKACAQKVLSEIGEGSVQSNAKDILIDLKLDWKNNPEKETAHYDDCGPSDFFYITIKKENCEIVEIGSGDSDGECE
ncbi:hypothetical protein DOM21_04665 [Bacteriovorax stolpii]|uniref:Uncharacterized protein n=1 Tax=Bacteriovorax stolpii TaxID=960 RepID=A0A2K9NUR5_BACTC|nr:hypothetical protein [Bacteriovorax stolpii]AUN99261.1 hypothetical protein C0V70_14335 [Bacteriovorax stolpii]QDK40758.1 hypothetical protein DOM21_04665 [Bacteriovorax stolpii]TDP55199.1 hypothetical protein C8D79_0244 [Bacteriovorax stolpii]